MSITIKIDKADLLINNSYSKEELMEQIEGLTHTQLLGLQARTD
jgi:hypothetical protein